MHSVKGAADQLALLGKNIDQEDLIDAILCGLNPKEYKDVILAVNARDTTISFTELHEKLITHELTLKQKQPVDLPAIPHTTFPVHIAATHYNRTNTQRGLLPTPSKGKDQKQTKPFLGHCQWCRQKGHYLSQCPSFKQTHPKITIPAATTTPSAQAHTATVTNATSPTWLLSSGASHHVTDDLSNLSIHAPYDGTEELLIGDGSSLPISYIGSSHT